jgi:hypothetical protein
MSSPKTKTMKKLALFAIAAFILSTGLMGQKKNAVKTDLFSAFLRTGVFKYERALNDDMGFQLGFFYTGYSPGDTDARLSGFGITPEFRLLPFRTESGSPWNLSGSQLPLHEAFCGR